VAGARRRRLLPAAKCAARMWRCVRASVGRAGVELLCRRPDPEAVGKGNTIF
jgi:hypothetical protein